MRAIPFSLAVLLTVAGGAATAQPLDGRSARAMTFDVDGAEVRLTGTGGLSAAHADVIAQVAAQQPYYGAIALSPSEGLASEAAVAAASFHDVPSARAFALENCNARRKPGASACVIAAEIYPQGWEARDLQLSADASAALRKEYRRGFGAKALAISPATGKFAVAKGEGAQAQAVAACERAAQSGDCAVVVAD